MLAVVEQAVVDLESPSPSIRWRARSWFLDRRGEDRPFTFTYICRELGYNPARVRARVFAGIRLEDLGTVAVADADGAQSADGAQNGGRRRPE
jgi:hypothetical protein